MRGTIEKLPSGSWRLAVSLGRDPATGRYARVRRTFEGTRKEAEKELTRLLRELDTGSYVEPSKESVAEYLARWLRDYVGTRIEKPKTRVYYRTIVSRHLVPALGPILLAKLTPTQVQRYYRDKLDGGLSPTTVHGHHQTLHRALECAVRWGLVSRNVCNAVEPPPRDRPEMKTWTTAECVRFLDAARQSGSRYYPVFATAIYTGLRLGELLGLRWSDVDLDVGTLTVQQTLERSGTSPTFGTPKTRTSRRTVPIPAELVAILRSWKAKQNEERLALGPEYRDLGLVFTIPGGGAVNADNLRKRDYARLVARAGVPRIRPHDLRHSHASLLLAANVNPKVVSERLGHSSIGITMDTYGHVSPTLQREAANVVGRLLAHG